MALNKNYSNRREGRLGIMLHYDGSSSDAGSVSWFKHPKCKVSYNYLVLDDGTVLEVVPRDKRAWHAGRCRSSSPALQYKDANSAFYGIAAACTDGDALTAPQFFAIVKLCRELFAAHGWHLPGDTWRITGHRDEAWPRGRKSDPYGAFDVEDIRREVCFQHLRE